MARTPYPTDHESEAVWPGASLTSSAQLGGVEEYGDYLKLASKKNNRSHDTNLLINKNNLDYFIFLTLFHKCNWLFLYTIYSICIDGGEHFLVLSDFLLQWIIVRLCYFFLPGFVALSSPWMYL